MQNHFMQNTFNTKKTKREKEGYTPPCVTEPS